MARQKRKTGLTRLIEIIDRVYPDGQLGLCHTRPHEDHGDGLAAFIVREVETTFEEHRPWGEQLLMALDALGRADMELTRVIAALSDESLRLSSDEAETDGATYVRCVKCGAYVVEGEFGAHASGHK